MSVSLVRLLVVERVTEEVVRFAAVNSSLAALLDELDDLELELEEDDFFDDSPETDTELESILVAASWRLRTIAVAQIAPKIITTTTAMITVGK